MIMALGRLEVEYLQFLIWEVSAVAFVAFFASVVLSDAVVSVAVLVFAVENRGQLPTPIFLESPQALSPKLGCSMT
jgi:hypothetical protein